MKRQSMGMTFWIVLTLCVVAPSTAQGADASLAAFYPFTAGSTADESGNGRHGTLEGAQPTTDRVGGPSNAFNFAAGGIRVPAGVGGAMTADFTLAAWIRPTSDAAGWVAYSHVEGNNGLGSWWLARWDGRLHFQATPFSTDVVSSPFPTGAWTHVVFTFNRASSAWTYYLNGVLDRSGVDTFAIQDTGLPMYLGIRGDGEFRLQGDLDEIRIYSRALGAADVAALAIEGNEPPDKLAQVKGIAASGRVYLSWDPPVEPIDHVRIAIARFNGTSFDPFGSQVLTRTPEGTGPDHRIVIAATEAGDALENGTLYRFTLVAELAGAQGEPSELFAMPGTFAAPSRPPQPLLFLHGFFGDENTFKDTAGYLSEVLGWTDGGILEHNGTAVPPPAVGAGLAHFYRGVFSGRTGSLAQQGREACDFIRALHARGAPEVAVLVHSNGGLAVRSCFDQEPGAADGVRQFITYGTPHRGADVVSLAANVAVLPGLASIVVPLTAAAMVTGGGRDATLFGCTPSGVPELSEFLTLLSTKQLPATLRYVAIVGHVPYLSRLNPACLGGDWDGLVPAASADLQLTGLVSQSPRKVIHRSEFHVGQGNDFVAYLCALDPTCVELQVKSPVDVELVAPDGRAVARRNAQLPGASFIETVDEMGHPIDSILIPFPMPGTYEVRVTPKAGAQPTETFTILKMQDGRVEVLAQDQPISAIPPGGYQVTVTEPGMAGRMTGSGHVDAGALRHHFAFRVSENASGVDRGRFRYHREPRHGQRSRTTDHFVADTFLSANFGDDPTIRPGRRAEPTVDTLTAAGTGRWNGLAGYRFELHATDGGEPGRRHDTVSLTIRDPQGAVVASVAGRLDGGNVQSHRVHRGR